MLQTMMLEIHRSIFLGGWVLHRLCLSPFQDWTKILQMELPPAAEGHDAELELAYNYIDE